MPSADDPFALIIFGASGDLTRRKLMPALWSLYSARTLPEPFVILAISRTVMTDDEFRTRVREAVMEFARVKPPSEHVWERFASALFYLSGDPSDPELYRRLTDTLGELERRRGGAPNRLFYCATPPSLYHDIVHNLGASGLARAEDGFTRLVIEKPFGRDFASARALNEQLAAVFTEVFHLARERVHPGLGPADVERWDSVGHVMLVTAVEQRFSIQFEVEEIMEFTTFEAILSAIERRMTD